MARSVRLMFGCNPVLPEGMEIETGSFPEPAVYLDPSGDGSCVPGMKIKLKWSISLGESTQVDLLDLKDEWLVVPVDSVKLTGHCGFTVKSNDLPRGETRKLTEKRGWTNRADIFLSAIRVLSEHHTAVPGDRTPITEDSDLGNDLGMDQIDFMAIVVELEDVFEIEIPDDAFPVSQAEELVKLEERDDGSTKLVGPDLMGPGLTVGLIVDYIERKLFL